MARGRKVCAEEALQLLERWERSGEPMSKWCAARGLNWYSLSAYKGWLCTRWDDEHVAEAGFAEVLVNEPATPEPEGGRYRIELDDIVIEVDDRFRDRTLLRLIEVLETC